jgi:hypothetical protein
VITVLPTNVIARIAANPRNPPRADDDRVSATIQRFDRVIVVLRLVGVVYCHSCDASEALLALKHSRIGATFVVSAT